MNYKKKKKIKYYNKKKIVKTNAVKGNIITNLFFFGLNSNLIKKILLRFEYFQYNNLFELNTEYSLIIETFFIKQLFFIFNIKKKLLLNIFFFCLISNYKGNRHGLGLPVNGQRT